MLESAIPEHLRKARTCPLSTPPNYNPPFPAYCARFKKDFNSLVMAVIGAQYSSAALQNGRGISEIKRFMTEAPETVRPSFWEIASVTDKRGALNIAILAYWPSAQNHKTWQTESGFTTWWSSPDRENDGHGWFQEVLCPTLDRFETVFSNSENPEGAAMMQDSISGEIEEHAYWGSMRDRLAAAQDNDLASEKWNPRGGAGAVPSIAADDNSPKANRIRIPVPKNLCIIRSGQDWSDTLPSERKLYLETMHPVLIKGMNFLRDEGRDIGCHAMNLWDVVDPHTLAADQERTFGLGYFHDLASLEYWSKSHQTHIDIFGGFLMYAKKLNNVLSLRLFHEVYVLDEGQGIFEYVGCHEETGILWALKCGVGKST